MTPSSAAQPRASVLVLTDPTDRLFGSPEALAELLRLEGINDVEAAPLSALDDRLLEGRSAVVLGPCDPAEAQAERLVAYVSGGGGLVALAPGEALAARLGLTQKYAGSRDAHWIIPLEGFPDGPLVVRGWSQFYALKPDAQGQAWGAIRHADGRPTEHAPVLEFRLGQGAAAIVAADLASAVLLARQGDPLLAGVRSSGFARMRPGDLFAGFGFVDADIPSADLLCRLLRELLHRVWPAGSVLPWLWHFPDNLDTLMLLTSDEDWAKRAHSEELVGACDELGAQATFYLTLPTAYDRTWVDQLVARGHEFSLHPDLAPPTGARWADELARHAGDFRERFGREPATSIRNHCIAWTGYLNGTRIQAAQGFHWDANYFTLPPLARSYMTRSGLPMRLVEPGGSVLESFQLPTQFSDETTLRAGGFEFSLKLEPDAGIALITGLIDRNRRGQHSLMTCNSHPVSFATYSRPLWAPVMQWCREQGLPVWPVGRFSRFWEVRRAVRLRPIGRGESLPASPAATGAGLRAMVPLQAGEAAQPGQITRTLAGRTFASIPLG